MRIVLLVLAIPVALGAYLVTGQVLAGMSLEGPMRELLLVFLPLFVAGLVAIPFIAPFVDMKAKQALADAPGARARAEAEARAKSAGGTGAAADGTVADRPPSDDGRGDRAP
jgi:hypothetical protein